MLVDPLRWLPSCIELRHLDLFGVHLPPSFLSSLSLHLPRLLSLDITSCELPESSILSVFSSMPPLELRSFTLSQPSSIQFLELIALKCPKLKRLECHLHPEHRLSDSSFSSFLLSSSSLLPNLKALSFWSLSSLSEETVELLLSTGGKLETVTLSVTLGEEREGEEWSVERFRAVAERFPSVALRIWNHSLIKVENRQFIGLAGDGYSAYELKPLSVNHLEVRLEVDDFDGEMYSTSPLSPPSPLPFLSPFSFPVHSSR